ncbi:MAG TPA: NAD(P)-dependent oxidoreductase [Polyangiaceae bacterium]|nr:NAD(P)-dependent oxidoreductase [Polyangiaceae bacterium]
MASAGRSFRATSASRRVAVTGAAGFLGLHLVHGLDARGASVLPIVRVVEPRSPAGAVALNDVLANAALLDGVDVLVHAAAVRHRYGSEASTYRASNVELVEHVIRAAARARVGRVVLVSSVGVYGFPAELPVAEDYPYAPRTFYSATKVEAETRARRAARAAGVPLVIARPSIFYGPGDRNGMLDKMASMIRTGTYRIVGPGDNVLHHAHVDDIVEGLWLAATRDEAVDEHFILAGPETITLAQLSALVAQAIGRELSSSHVPSALARAVATVVDVAAHRGFAFVKREPPINHEKLDVMTVPIAFDISKARRMLGYEPTVGYEEGIMRTLRGEWPALARLGAPR